MCSLNCAGLIARDPAPGGRGRAAAPGAGGPQSAVEPMSTKDSPVSAIGWKPTSVWGL